VFDALLAYVSLLDAVCAFSIMALSQYIALRGGLYSLATPAFALIGAYCGAILLKDYKLDPILCAGLATSAGIAAGLLLSVPLAKLRGGFQAIATIGFAQILISLVLYAENLTGGALGYNAIPKVVTTPILVIALAMVVVFLAIINRSSIGCAFDAIRQDDTVAASLGISVARYFRLNFALSGALGALGGCLLAFNTFSISPEEFGFPLLVVLVAAVVLGGRASIAGAIVGTAILLALPELIRPLRDQRLLLQGAILIAVIIYLPNGIIDSIIEHVTAYRGRTRRAS
jgi:branched-chain amino acid transport system permease protein